MVCPCTPPAVSQSRPNVFTVDAFVACGGNPDKTGHVQRSTLVKIVKDDFGLTIDIEKLIDDIDEDRSGEIEYAEFKQLLS